MNNVQLFTSGISWRCGYASLIFIIPRVMINVAGTVICCCYTSGSLPCAISRASSSSLSRTLHRYTGLWADQPSCPKPHQKL